jgi:hypothetical protein
MSDNQERYYVVSESELVLALTLVACDGPQAKSTQGAIGACRSRPVEEFGTLGDSNIMWEEIR